MLVKKNKNKNRKNKSNQNFRNNKSNALGSLTYRNIPTTIAPSIRQNANPLHQITRLSGRDIIASINVGALPIGQVFRFDMSPLALLTSRLSNLASSFEEYRFINLALTPFTGLSSATAGGMVLGYSANAELDLSVSTSLNGIQSLPGACMFPIWAPEMIPAVTLPANKWYVIDAESSEVQNSIQGAFFGTAASLIPSPTSMIFYLSYTIEFRGAVMQSAVKGGTISLTADASLVSVGTDPAKVNAFITTDPQIGSLQAGQIYMCEPDITIYGNLSGPGAPEQTPVYARAYAHVSDALDAIRVAKSVDAMRAGEYLQPYTVASTFKIPAGTIFVPV